MNTPKYPLIYWGPQNETEVQFIESDTLPRPLENITTCMVAVFNKQGQLLLAKSQRGWGLPGGHIEPGETLKQCAARECLEEACATVANSKLIGYWKTRQIKKVAWNEKYPPLGYQLLYLAELGELLPFKDQFETNARKFIDPTIASKYFTNYKNFKPILQYILSKNPKV